MFRLSIRLLQIRLLGLAIRLARLNIAIVFSYELLIACVLIISICRTASWLTVRINRLTVSHRTGSCGLRPSEWLGIWLLWILLFGLSIRLLWIIRLFILVNRLNRLVSLSGSDRSVNRLADRSSAVLRPILVSRLISRILIIAISHSPIRLLIGIYRLTVSHRAGSCCLRSSEWLTICIIMLIIDRLLRHSFRINRAVCRLNRTIGGSACRSKSLLAINHSSMRCRVHAAVWARWLTVPSDSTLLWGIINSVLNLFIQIFKLRVLSHPSSTSST